MAKSKYTTCTKCKERHSALVRHRCPSSVKKGDKFAKALVGDGTDNLGDGNGPSDAGDEAGEGQSEGQGQGNGQSQGQSEGQGAGEGQGEGEGSEGQGDSQGEGEGQSDGEGQGDAGGDTSEGQGEGEAQQGEGEGEEGQSQDQQQGDAGADDDGEGEDGEGEGEAPQSPEPEAPPVAVVCSVLKYAALTARCAKNGTIVVELTDEGLFIYGHNGERTAHHVIGWGEFETRSTIDGQFLVKEKIDEVDAGIKDDGGAALRASLPLS